MIDTKELRRLAQEAMHPVTKGRWMRLFGERTVYDRMEDGCRGIPVVSTPVNPPHPFEAACLDFIAAANPAVISELLDRLEAAEADALEQARLNGMGSEREAALLSKLEAAEKERDDVAQQLVQSEIGKREISEAHDALRVEVGKLKDLEVSRCVKINGYIVDNARLAEEVERLRASLEAAEKAVTEAYQRGYATGQEEIEKELAELRSSMKFRTSLIGRAEAERDALRAENETLAANLRGKHSTAGATYAHLIAERDALRAKIETMEKQGPVATVRINAINGNPSVDFIPGHSYLHHNDKLYLASGAQSVPDVDALAQFIREIDGKHQLGAGALAERIVEWLAADPEAKP